MGVRMLAGDYALWQFCLKSQVLIQLPEVAGPHQSQCT